MDEFNPEDDLVNAIKNEMASHSGLHLFQVSIDWANQGRTGNLTRIVLAPDAIAASKRAWEMEDDADIRSLVTEWLSPVECVVRWNDYRCKICDAELDDNDQCPNRSQHEVNG